MTPCTKSATIARGAVAVLLGLVPAHLAEAAIVTTTGSAVDPSKIDFLGSTQFTVSFAGTLGTIAGTGSNVVSTASGGNLTSYGPGSTIGPAAFTSSTASTSLPPKTNYFVGLDVNTAPGVNNYGYAEIGTNALVSYGFETTANTAIVTPDLTSAPEITPVPEPASLVLLAMGTAGVAAIRRRSRRRA